MMLLMSAGIPIAAVKKGSIQMSILSSWQCVPSQGTIEQVIWANAINTSQIAVVAWMIKRAMFPMMVAALPAMAVSGFENSLWYVD